MSSTTNVSQLSSGDKSNCYADDSNLQEPSIIINTCLASVIELGLRCSSAIPDERTPMNEVVVKLNKIKMDYCSQLIPQNHLLLSCHLEQKIIYLS